METLAHCNFAPATTSPSNPSLKPYRPITSLPCSNSFKPFASFTRIPVLSHSLTIRPSNAHIEATFPKRFFRLLALSGSADGNSGTYPDAEPNVSNTGGKVDLKLPRRSLLVQFTCGECGARTQRLINRLAYERGLVYVQCAGCERYHKFVDNLGLVVEYDLRDETSAESDKDQVC